MDERFEFIRINEAGVGFKVIDIIVDKETGVQYLMPHIGNISGLSVLVDKDGKPLLDPRYAK